MRNYFEEVKDILELEKRLDYKKLLNRKFEKYKYVCIYGMGEIGHNTLNALQENGFKVDMFCDSDIEKVGKVYKTVTCISLERLYEFKEDTIILIASALYYNEIKEMLILKGFKNFISVEPEKFRIEKELKQNRKIILDSLGELLNLVADDISRDVILEIVGGWYQEDFKQESLNRICTHPQYFPENIIRLGETEVFFDCGAFTGDSFKAFLKETEGKLEAAVLFELSSTICSTLQENVYALCNKYGLDKRRIMIVPKGVSNRRGQIQYSEDSASSLITDGEGITGQIDTIDNFIEECGVIPSFLKMDIEGEEISALLGTQNSIKKYKPKLAICIYHRVSDLWEIPFLLSKMLPSYKIYVRHHTNMLIETVCYAVLDKDYRR